MGSFQQILLGGICLAAAFGMGHYLNNKPVTDLPAGAIAESKSDTGNGFRWGKAESPSSFLESPEATPSATIVTMREPVSSNLPMLKSPSAITSESMGGADLSNLMRSPGNSGNVGSASIPNIIDNQRQKVIVVPDFSELAASFKDTPLELPPMQGVRTPNSRADDAPAGNLRQNPRNESVDPYADAPNAPTRVRETAPAADLAPADFAPELTSRRFSDTAEFQEFRESRNDSQEMSSSKTRQQSLADNRQPIDNRLFVDPPVVPDFSILEQESVNDGRNVSLRAEVEQQTTNRATRPQIPFGLTEEAKTELVGLRKPADRQLKIGAKRFDEYVTVEGDSLQSLSSKFYGRPDFYLDIYLSNQSRLRNPAELPIGTRLQIPMFE